MERAFDEDAAEFVFSLAEQAGYLTIKTVGYGTAYLDYPNREVAESMAQYYTQVVLKRRNLAQIGAGDIIECLKREDADTFVDRLNKAFLAIDYTGYPVTDEYKCCAMAAMFLAGSGLAAMSQTHNDNALGRSDLEAVLGSTRWVLEFKFARKGDDPETLLAEALKQAGSRKYGVQSPETRLMHVGLVFSEDRRQFVAYGAREAAAK